MTKAIKLSNLILSNLMMTLCVIIIVYFGLWYSLYLSAQSRNSAGGTAKEKVLEQITLIREK